jgi:hypothetical protein
MEQNDHCYRFLFERKAVSEAELKLHLKSEVTGQLSMLVTFNFQLSM